MCNEMAALCNRHLIDRDYIGFDLEAWKQAEHDFDIDVPALTRVGLRELVMDYTGSKRRAYYGAMLELIKGGWHRKDARVSMFVKPDRYSSGDIKEKAPRAIQFRSMKYNLMVASYLKPFEHWFYQQKLGCRHRVVAKGLNPYERAQLYADKINEFHNPVFIECDHSKFDSTIRVEHLRTIHRLYKRAFPHDSQLRQLLHLQLYNKGYTKHGIKYKVAGTRMSGDFDTGLGNSFINYITIESVLRVSGVRKFEIILDGDDSIIIIEDGDKDKMRYDHFKNLGFETKIKVKNDPRQVDFCQCRYIRYPVHNFVRNPIRAISHSMATLKMYTPKKLQQWKGGVGMCELALNIGSPVLQALGIGMATSDYWLDQDMRIRMGRLRPGRVFPVSADARHDYFMAWGIDEEMQMIMEDSFTDVTFQISDCFGKDTHVVAAKSVRTRDGISFCSLDANVGKAWGAISSECL